MEPARAINNIVEIQVGIADYKTAREPARLITLGLGSCVGVSLYDPALKLGGLLHLMLPDSTQFTNVTKPAKFADLGIPLLIQEMQKEGASPSRLKAKLVGGAQMFSGLDSKMILNIGQRNVEKARQMLKEYGIPILAEEVGGNRGRTMIFDTSTGQVSIRMLGNKLKVI
ncbi:MAG: chemotaxis protein CheD [Thermoanaerobacteraceae bacterium]|uniref:Probable chemoreceptor glutamine deamidase CheD n=1 Tax=Desulfofundulus thermobenzoicus TaxID=29376 RepID=A0A6N7IN80_9FIRM|nr:chemotaxis protein CheD [Desulfofundulus thermobenzoicus]MBE3588280.1 chemotaxis protein CheD [Thermoanaerobacteraceae bacterium]MQL51411.1 chemotaxis protein CheD [Desulfofundulus thermobenzoicus]